MPGITSKKFLERDAVKILLGFSILAWIFIFRDYLAGKPAMSWHGIDYYFIIKYYLDNLSRGVFPLWDPFGAWGRPDELDQLFIGAYNPFLWIYSLLATLHVPRPTAFLTYCFVYYQVGVIGFYLLADRLFRDCWLALVAAVAFMFSSHTLAIFNNYCINLLIIPGIWFFYYLLAFAQQPKRHFFLGLIFSAALIASTYMPFYFLTLLQPFVLGVLILYWPSIKTFFCKTRQFVLNNRIFFGVCLAFFMFAVIPGLLWFVSSSSGELVLSWRHAEAQDNHTASMGLGTIIATSHRDLVALQGLFPGADSYYFVTFLSVFIFIVLTAGIINKLNRLLILLFMMATWLFLVALGDLTPLHGFLFHNIFIYRLFRNLIYLVYYASPVVILFAIGQLRLLLKISAGTFQRRTGLVIYVWVMHGLMALFLLKVGGVFPTTFVVLGLSALFFTLKYENVLRSMIAIGVMMWSMVIIQPMEFFTNYTEKVKNIVPWATTDFFVPKFSYIRPLREEENFPYRSKGESFGKAGNFFKGKSPQENQDSAGFDYVKFTGLRWCYELQRNIHPQILEKYTRHKFVVYDRVETMDPQRVDYQRLSRAFAENENVAFVFGQPNDSVVRLSDGSPKSARFIESDDPLVKVKEFDLNSIRFTTNFRKEEFLVYNDAYHREWQATINGKPTKIYQANAAFKGIWVPAGKNDVFFRYGSLFRYAMNYFGLGLYAAAFLLLVGLTIQERSRNGREILEPQ
jgi:hypothetical protein